MQATTVVGILTYAGCTDVDIFLNYSVLGFNTLVLTIVCLNAPSNPMGTLLAPLITVGLLVFQIALCMVVGCSGISVVWSAQAGYVMVNGGRGRMQAASCLVSLALGLYYLITAALITSVAHLCAAALGAVVAVVISRLHSQVGYTAVDSTIPTPPVEVKDSWIRGAGQGLFATAAIPKGTIVCAYTGAALGTADAMRCGSALSNPTPSPRT